MDLYSMPRQSPRFNRIGVFFISFCATWTALLLLGIGFLIYHRNNPIVKIRSLPLTVASMLMLHSYWILGQITYPIGPSVPAVLAYDIQYFFMALYYPLGIALFQASNLRFLHIAKLQRYYLQPTSVRSGCNGSKTSILCRLRNQSYKFKMMVLISIGMIAQIALSIGMWVSCRKCDHPTFGIKGTELIQGTIEQQMIDLGRGYEWWPTLLWQTMWTWVLAPYLIAKSWNIRDTLGWRMQTIGCCIASLHAVPMFLIASYVPAFNPINLYFTPSNWIHLSIMIWEILTVLFPCWKLVQSSLDHRHQRQLEQSRDSVSSTNILPPSLKSIRSKVSSPTITSEKTGNDSKAGAESELRNIDDDRLMTMSALGHVLNTNPAPLQEFSSLRDFSGENIAFLTHVSRWKSESFASHNNGTANIHAVYTKALEIYTTFISPNDAEFPINISSTQLQQLDEVFEEAARVLCGAAKRADSLMSSGSDDSSRLELGEVIDRLQYTGKIPTTFSMTVFDDAYMHIKELVFRNTWPKFMRELKARDRLYQARHQNESLAAFSRRFRAVWSRSLRRRGSM